MRIEAIALTLRPRLSLEAADLGLALARAEARSVWRAFGPLFGLVVLLAVATFDIAPWLPMLLIWWLKPWLDCSLLFILSRAVFGQSTSPADLWRERSAIWGGQWLRVLFRQRLAPWRSFTQPICQLEGLRGKALRERRRLLLKGRGGAAMMMQFAFSYIETALYLGLLLTILLFTPENQQAGLFSWFFGEEESGWVDLLQTFLYAAVVLALEPFFVAAGLTMYLNRRVELEAWDIEQEFRHVF
ncbi:MAG: hypothetical protein LBE62_05020 [Azonexus sp.]|jgi:hypothetical protein|nr:hypothetical protein [Azonexus sp.]